MKTNALSLSIARRSWFELVTKSCLLLGFTLFVHQALAGEALPRPDHVVIVIEENKSFSQIIANDAAPYINSLAQRGVLFTESFGVTHPSQPNYLALFSGSTHGVHSNACPLKLSGENLASALVMHGLSFNSYSQSMLVPSFAGCMYGAYMRKHNPVSNWYELAPFNHNFTSFPHDFSQLPTVAFVIPDQQNDMHDDSIAKGDSWLSHNLDQYALWAMTHNSLLVVTWDEDNGSENNRVATILVGPMVKPGISAQHINHYSVLRMLSDMYGLPYLGESNKADSISSVWQTAHNSN